MLTLTDREAVAGALNDPDLNPCLRALLAIRVAELFGDDHAASLHVVQGGGQLRGDREGPRLRHR